MSYQYLVPADGGGTFTSGAFKPKYGHDNLHQHLWFEYIDPNDPQKGLLVSYCVVMSNKPEWASNEDVMALDPPENDTRCHYCVKAEERVLEA